MKEGIIKNSKNGFIIQYTQYGVGDWADVDMEIPVSLSQSELASQNVNGKVKFEIMADRIAKITQIQRFVPITASLDELKFKFTFEDSKNGNKNTSSEYSLREIMDGKNEEEISIDMIDCNCQPVGETNVVECNCEDIMANSKIVNVICYI